MKNFYFLLCLCCLTLPSCTKKSRVFLPERITRQHEHSVVIFPQEYELPLPSYAWDTPSSPVITTYSFCCKGNAAYIETPNGEFYDCRGLDHSMLTSFPIHPKLILLSRALATYFPLTIVEGYCCKKHLLFLQESGHHISTRHQEGLAALLFLPTLLTIEQASVLLSKALPKEPPFTPSSPNQMKNSICQITLHPLPGGTEVSIEILT